MSPRSTNTAAVVPVAGRVYRLPGSGRLIKFEHRRKREFERALAEAAREWVKDGLGTLERPQALLTLQPAWAASLLIAYGVTDGPIAITEADTLIDQAAEAGTEIDELVQELIAALTGIRAAGPPTPEPTDVADGGAGVGSTPSMTGATRPS